MGFLNEAMSNSMLPLLINFEAKSIAAKFPELKETMEKRYFTIIVLLLSNRMIVIVYDINIIVEFN